MANQQPNAAYIKSLAQFDLFKTPVGAKLEKQASMRSSKSLKGVRAFGSLPTGRLVEELETRGAATPPRAKAEEQKEVETQEAIVEQAEDEERKLSPSPAKRAAGAKAVLPA
jgi:hypothetical protein